MLGKLIKYEWKRSYKVCGALLLFVLAVTLVEIFSFWVLFQGDLDNPASSFATYLEMVTVFGVLLYFLILAGIAFGIVIYIGVLFYRTMFTEEGYLTHTLPVKAWQLLVSKLTVGSLWYLVSMAVIVLSIVGFGFSMVLLGVQAMDVENSWELFQEGWKDVWELLSGILGKVSLLDVLIFIVANIIACVSMMMRIFGAVTLAQLSSKYRAVLAIVYYFAITLAASLLRSVLSFPFSSMMYADFQAEGLVELLTPSQIFNLVFEGVIAAVLYALSHYIVSRKLSLE